MSCPTCDHTMSPMGCKITDATFYWCPRCGTIKPCDHAAVAPAIIDRCRNFAVTLKNSDGTPAEHRNHWRVLGVAESINRPEDRTC
jgi:hypothetical protein